MDAENLCKAVSHWLEYEHLCGRSGLLSEAALRQPIGEFLIATQDRVLQAEEPYPDEMQPSGPGRRKSLDFCLKRPTGNDTWVDLFETKWDIGRRNLSQEIFDDLLRLEAIRRPDQTEIPQRYFILAGREACVQETLNRAIGNIQPFLSMNEAVPKYDIPMPVANAPQQIRDYWEEAAKACRQDGIPLSMYVDLHGISVLSQFSCRVWRVSSVPNKQTRPLSVNDQLNNTLHGTAL